MIDVGRDPGTADVTDPIVEVFDHDQQDVWMILLRDDATCWRPQSRKTKEYEEGDSVKHFWKAQENELFEHNKTF